MKHYFTLFFGTLAVATLLVGCGSQPIYVADYQENMVVMSANNDAERVQTQQEGNLIYLQYKLGEIKECYVQNVTTPIYNDGSIKKITYQESALTSETISEGFTRTISTSKSTTITGTSSATVSCKIGVNFAVIPRGASVISTIGSSFTNSNSESRAQSTTETINRAYDVSKLQQETHGMIAEFDMSSYEIGYYYALAFVADVNVYQVIVYDAVAEEFYTTYFVSEIANTNKCIKMISAKTTSFEIDESKQLKPITEINKELFEDVVGDSGSMNNAVKISTEDELKQLASNPNSHYVLTSDIVIKGEWPSIDNFSGILDGNNHTISGLKIESENGSAGMFNRCSGIIKNLKVVNAEVTTEIIDGDAIVGVLVGELTSGKIVDCETINCAASAYASDKKDTENRSRYSIVGGIVGKISGGEISNCKVSDASIYGYAKKHDVAWSDGWNEAAYVYAGGVVGEYYGGSVKNNNVLSLKQLEGYTEYRGNSMVGIEIDTRSRICLGGVIGKQNGSAVFPIGNTCMLSSNIFKGVFNSYNENKMARINKIEELKTGEIVGFNQ